MRRRPGYGIRLDSSRRLLAQHVPVGITQARWPGGTVQVSAYLGEADLPAEIPHRVRCLVTRGTDVLVVWDPAGNPDCFPGGGAEPGETIVQTAHREVLEETGWHIDDRALRVLGWFHIYSYAEPRPDHAFPHPDGFMTVVHVPALTPEPGHDDWQDVEGFVTRSEFVAADELPEQIARSPIHVPFLDLVLGDGWGSAPTAGVG